MAESSSALQLRYLQVCCKYFSDKSHDADENDGESDENNDDNSDDQNSENNENENGNDEKCDEEHFHPFLFAQTLNSISTEKNLSISIP